MPASRAAIWYRDFGAWSSGIFAPRSSTPSRAIAASQRCTTTCVLARLPSTFWSPAKPSAGFRWNADMKALPYWLERYSMKENAAP